MSKCLAGAMNRITTLRQFRGVASLERFSGRASWKKITLQVQGNNLKTRADAWSTRFLQKLFKTKGSTSVRWLKSKQSKGDITNLTISWVDSRSSRKRCSRIPKMKNIVYQNILNIFDLYYFIISGKIINFDIGKGAGVSIIFKVWVIYKAWFEGFEFFVVWP